MNTPIGEIRVSNEGCKMKIIEYNKWNDVVVEFQDEYKFRTNTTYNNFKKGEVRNLYCKRFFNIGYIGVGEYKVSIDRKKTKCYEVWYNMIKRCYDAYTLNKHLTYIDCYVCEEWHNFQNFAEWYYENYYEIEGERMHLDKDILVKGNKMYSPNTCCFVPSNINMLFTKCNKSRGRFPIGVCLNKNNYQAFVNIYNFETNKSKQRSLGTFPTVEKAFNIYKKEKEKEIKRRADYYKDLIPNKLYESLMNYEVETND